jgi:uncharacterized membrane protein YhaH (DUF805 family)
MKVFGIEIVLEYQAKFVGALRHRSIISSGLFPGFATVGSVLRKEQVVVNSQPPPANAASQAPPLELPYYGISFGGAIARGFKKYATFTGRASRSEYWWWALFTFVVYLVLGLITFAIGTATSRDGGRTPGLLAIPLIIVFAVFFLGIIVPTLALTVRRLHDAGYSGLFALLLLLPYLGSLIMMIFALLPSSSAGEVYDQRPAVPGPQTFYPPQHQTSEQDPSSR